MTPPVACGLWSYAFTRHWLSNMCSIISIGPTFSAERPRIASDVIELVSGSDGRTHRVTERAYGCALLVGAGHCVAVCGHDVVLCALTTPAGPWCRRCAYLP